MKNEYRVGDLVCLKNQLPKETFTITRVAPIKSPPASALPVDSKIPVQVECGIRTFWGHEVEPKQIQVGDKVRCLSDSKIYKVTHDHVDTLNLECEEECVRVLFALKGAYRAISTQAASDLKESRQASSPLVRKLKRMRIELDKFEAESHTNSGTVDPHANDKIRALLDVAESLVEINLTETHDDPDKGIYETLSSVLNLRGRRWDYLR